MRGWRRAIAGWALLCAACSDPPADRPTIVLITLDTTRADHLSLYGYERQTDPTLLAWADRSRVFDAAIAPATWTLPSHATIFTGLDPAEHGSWLRSHPDEPDTSHYPPLAEELPRFTERLAAAGYHLVGLSGGPFTGERYGFARDFDTWHGTEPDAQLHSSDINALVVEALDARPVDRPLFLFVNYFDAHSPYAPPTGRAYPFPQGVGDLPWVPELSGDDEVTPEELALAVDQYDREILVQDEALGEMLAGLEERGLLADALVIVTADHGEAFGEQGFVGHGGLPIEAVSHVPLVVHHTGGPVDRVAAPVSLAHLATTILVAAGLPALPTGGSERLDLLEPSLATPPAYAEMRTPRRWVGMLRHGSTKYYRDLPPGDGPAQYERLVDLGADPRETDRHAWSAADWNEAPRSFLAEGLRLQAHMRSLLDAWAEAPALGAAPAMSDAERLLLEELGYF